MPSIVKYLLRRLLAIPVSLIIITMVLYGFIMLTPVEERASLYLPQKAGRMSVQGLANLTERIIVEHGLRDPFPIQWGNWAVNLIKGEWGYSILMQAEVLPTLVRRSSATIELTLYSLLFYIPVGLITGLRAGRYKNSRFDNLFRFFAFTSLSVPQFVLGILLLDLFYIGFHVFPPGRIDYIYSAVLSSEGYHAFTGLYTIDGLLNGRFDLALNAFAHLVLPAITLGLLNWATLARVARVSTIEEYHQQHILAARARGVPAKSIAHRHILKNIIAPSLTSSSLGATVLFTGAIVVEHTFNINGISELMRSINAIPDAPAVMGFAVFCVLCVTTIMLLMDILQAVFDPRFRDGVLEK
jgi:peptide/nickel transport system permease protein